MDENESQENEVHLRKIWCSKPINDLQVCTDILILNFHLQCIDYSYSGF